MYDLNFNDIKEIIYEVKKAYKESKNINDKNIKNKELNDIVTDVDLFMEKRIVSFIKEKWPQHSIYSEEIGNDEKNSEYQYNFILFNISLQSRTYKTSLKCGRKTS